MCIRDRARSEKHREYCRNYYKKNKEELIAKQKDYYKNNIGSYKDYHKTYYKTHRDRLLDYQKKYGHGQKKGK